jgi:hypothetical protein
MYEVLTTKELAVLQSMLYEAVEEVFRTINVMDGQPVWAELYRPLHWELGHLFIEAGTELVQRLDQHVPAA